MSECLALDLIISAPLTNNNYLLRYNASLSKNFSKIVFGKIN